MYKPPTDMFEQMLKTLDKFDTKGLKDITSMFGKRNNDFDEKRVKALQQQLYMYASDLQKQLLYLCKCYPCLWMILNY